MTTWLEYTGAETMDRWAENQGRTLDALDLILDGLDEAMDDAPAEIRSALMAAHLLLSEARVLPRLLKDEAAFAIRMTAQREAIRTIQKAGPATIAETKAVGE